MADQQEGTRWSADAHWLTGCQVFELITQTTIRLHNPYTGDHWLLVV